MPGFESLNERQRNNFLARLKLLGIPKEEVLGVHINTADHGGVARVSGDLASSAMVTRILTLHSIEEKAAIAGVPASVWDKPGNSDAHIDYPAPIKNADKLAGRYGRRELAQLLGLEGQAEVHKAHQAWMQGDSRKVKEMGYEPLINALHFPQKVAVAAGESLTVNDGEVKQIGDPNQPVSVDYATITIYGTGQIQAVGQEVAIISQTMTHSGT